MVAVFCCSEKKSASKEGCDVGAEEVATAVLWISGKFGSKEKETSSVCTGGLEVVPGSGKAASNEKELSGGCEVGAVVVGVL